MPETPNHSYNVPDEGATDWHRPLNENFRQYDTDIEIRDTAANLSNYQPTDGAKFLATDTGLIYLGDGTEWTPALALPRYTPPSQNDDLAGNVIGGHPANVLRADFGATIAGGGRQSAPNKVTDTWGTIGGGYGNTAGGGGATVGGGFSHNASELYATVGGGNGNVAVAESATVGGGEQNTVRGQRGTIGGGWKNDAEGDRSTVAGGWQNLTTGTDATVAGGSLNSAEGANSTVAGGKRNRATGQFSFAAGRKADASANGTFVWADSTDDGVTARTADEFLARASGGVSFYTSSDLSTGVEVGAGEGTWSSVSARAAKRNVQSVDTDAVLCEVERMDVHRWEYDSASKATHMGPMAGEFHDAFGLGRDAEHIDAVDADGVALAAIQGLSDRLDKKEGRVDELEAEVERRDDRIDELETVVDDQSDRIDELEATVERLVEQVGAERSEEESGPAGSAPERSETTE